jgi:hypothetical protein
VPQRGEAATKNKKIFNHKEPSAAEPQPKGRRVLTTKGTKVTDIGTAIAVPFPKIHPERPVPSKVEGYRA